MLFRIKLRTKPIFWIFHILEINRITPFCNLFMGRPSYILDAVPPVHVVSNHVDSDKHTTANGGTFTSSSASLSSQSR